MPPHHLRLRVAVQEQQRWTAARDGAVDRHIADGDASVVETVEADGCAHAVLLTHLPPLIRSSATPCQIRRTDPTGSPTTGLDHRCGVERLRLQSDRSSHSSPSVQGVAARSSGGVDERGRDPVGDAVGHYRAPALPLVFSVVVAAEQVTVVDAGGPVVFVAQNVVDLTSGGGLGTPGEGASPIASGDRPALVLGEDSVDMAVVGDGAHRVQRDGEHGGVTAAPAQCLSGGDEVSVAGASEAGAVLVLLSRHGDDHGARDAVVGRYVPDPHHCLERREGAVVGALSGGAGVLDTVRGRRRSTEGVKHGLPAFGQFG